MAQPSSRQGLIDYGLRQLGAPVLEINIDDDQIDDLLDDAIQVFNERHFDGVEEMFLKYEFTQADIDRGKLIRVLLVYQHHHLLVLLEHQLISLDMEQL